MSNVMLTGLSALRTAQRALETTSHNVANVNTPGYSRQRVELGARMPQQFQFGSIGNGVNITNVQRSYDMFLAGAVTSNLSEFNRLDSFAQLSSRLGALMDNPDTGVSNSLQSFFSAAGDVANDPASLTAREALLGESRVIVERFNQLSTQLGNLDSEVNGRIQQQATEIDGLAQAVADLNRQIVTASGGDRTREPNDLLDQRGRLVEELAGKVGVTTIMQKDGALNVFFGSGQPLVVSGDAADVKAVPDARDPSRITIQAGQRGVMSDVTGSVSGGTLGGLLDFAREGLGSARNELGLIATAFATGLNAQHRSGMDLNGDLGGDFFTLAAPVTIAAGSNTGSGAMSAAIADVEAMTASDYRVLFDGSAYTFMRSDSGETVPFTGTGSSGDPFLIEGVAVTLTGAPAAGDEFLLRPTRGAAGNLSLALDSPRQIAAALPVRADPDLANIGGATITTLGVDDPQNPALLTSAVVRFVDASTYEINGAGSFPYTPGQPISINGAQFAITGAVQAGDSFNIESNDGGIGDNRNMLALAGMMSAGILDGGRASLNESVGQLIARVGVSSREAGRSLDAQGALLEQSQNRQLELSGVNLDEEAANMLQFQKTYEAAAQMIAVADSMFATLLNAVRR